MFKVNKNEISEFLKNIYMNNSIYILNYPEGKDLVLSIGQPPIIFENKIHHKCQTNEGSSGSPILLSNNQKVIGVNYGSSNHLDGYSAVWQKAILHKEIHQYWNQSSELGHQEIGTLGWHYCGIYDFHQ